MPSNSPVSQWTVETSHEVYSANDVKKNAKQASGADPDRFPPFTLSGQTFEKCITF